MSLSHLARSHHLTRQRNRLALCLGIAIVAHGLLFLKWSWERRDNRQAQQDPIGVEFVYLDPATPQTEKPDSSRRAQINSIAGGTSNPDLPTNAGKAAPPSAAQPPIEASSPSTTQPPIDPTPPRPATSVSRSTERPSATDSPGSASNPATAQSALAPRTPSPQRITPRTPASLAVNAQSGQGLDGQINPDRTSTGTASLNAEGDALWGAYVSALNRKIDQQWQRIAVSERREAKVQFEVDRQGRLVNSRLVQSSGDSSADSIALQAIQLAAPFTPFPPEIKESRLLVNFTFTYYPANPSAN